MLTVGRAASHDLYYDKTDDYYRGDARAAARWLGAGAGELGLVGRIASEDSRAAFTGATELFGRQIGGAVGGQRRRLPGVDLTFSASKSVSIMALVIRDERLVTAHDAAVRATLAFVERSATARVREGGGIRQERTGSLVVATWRHDTSRAQDPQLHTHAVIVNATRTRDGIWRSLDTRPFFTATFAKEIGARYRAELAARVAELGYRLELGPDCRFEIAGVQAADRERFSQRTAQIDRALAERGIDPATAPAAQVKLVAKDTRDPKVAVDHDQLLRLWRTRAGDTAMQRWAGLLRSTAPHARRREAGSEPQTEVAAAERREPARSRAAEQAVAAAARHLGERDARFGHDRLVWAASERAFGQVTPTALELTVMQLADRGALQSRTVHAYDPAARAIVAQPGWTTRAAVRIEQAMLAHLQAGRGAVAPLADAVAARRVTAAAESASRGLGHDWTPDQHEATRTLLSARDRVVGLQGLAGTAKTSTVLAAYARAARTNGFAVTALGATGSAARTLGGALGFEAATVDRFLGRLAADAAHARATQVWIVDEASLLSARLTADLLAAAARQDARVVLVGDSRQLGSVEAGAAFRQLQEHGLLTARLETIVRQTSAIARHMVHAAARGDPGAALDRLTRGGGSITELAAPEERQAALADAYVRALQDAIGRRGDVAAAFADVLAIDPSREGRAKLTGEIRERLLAAGIVGREALTTVALERRDLTREEAKDVLRYRRGDLIRFGAAISRHGIAAGEHLRVAAIAPRTNTLTLHHPDGRAILWNPAARGARTHATTVFADRTLDIAAGDRLTLTRNDPRGWANGSTAMVVDVGFEARVARIRLDDGRVETLALDRLEDRHWRHGYVETAYAAQGRTTGEVFAHAESWRVNLVTQASLYVLLSRARSAAHLFTDDRARLAEAVAGRSGQQPTALERQRRQHLRRGWQVVSSLDRLMAGTRDRLRSLADRLRITMARVSARRIQLAHQAAHQRLQTPDPSLLARQRQR